MLKNRVVLQVLALALSLAALPAQAQSLRKASEVQAFTDQVMAAVGRGDLEAAYGALKGQTLLPAAEIDTGLQGTRAQRANEMFAARYGKTLGHDFISKKTLGRSMMRLVYIERAERQPLPWVFHFYLTDKGWLVNEFGWDGSPAALYLAD